MSEAKANERARIDALVACSQRTVWVATWEPASDTYRTLEHDDGHTALPVFSDEWELDKAAQELEWSKPGFRVARREIGARVAMRYVIIEQLGYLVIDVASEHCVEATRAEIEPLSKATRSDSQGPFAAVGRITSTMIEAVRTSHAPTGIAILGNRESSHPPAALALPGNRESPDPGANTSKERSEPTIQAVAVPKHRESSSPTIPSLMLGPDERTALAPTEESVPASDENVAIVPMTGDPPDLWLDAYGVALKNFPEVEWACFCLASFNGATPIPMVAMRVDASFRQRVPEIGLTVANVSASLRIRVGTLIVDQANILRDARADGVPFLPWRRRKSTPHTPPT